jgi:hypothetical protein
MSGSHRGLKPMHRRMTLSCVVLAAALMGSAGVARPVECHSEKGAGYPWAWRQIDGKRCWYKGMPGMDKKQLRWGETASAPAAAKRPQAVMNDDSAERERLLHSYWPPLPQEGSGRDDP